MDEKTVTLVRKLKTHYPDINTTIQRIQRDPYKVLINSILSQRTREENAAKASTRLFKRVGSPQELIELPEDELKELIRCSGFYNQKARYLKQASKVIHEKYDGEIPSRMELLVDLPGVGPKTAAIVLYNGFGEPHIAVDTHVKRVSKRIGLVNREASSKQVKSKLETIFSKSDWNLIDNSFYSIGRKHCKNKRPRCNDCPISEYCEKKGL